MNPLLRRSAAHVFVESLSAPEITEADDHHLRRVLRLADGQSVTLSDGDGGWCAARWSTAGGVQVDGPVVVEPPAAAELTVGCAIPKGDRVELVVGKLTEIGIDRVVLFETARSVVRWGAERQVKQLDRLRRIAREAAAQSRRVRLPRVEVLTFRDAVALDGAVIAEPGAAGCIDDSVNTVLIGPEGGFDQVELAAAGRTIGLGETVLRVETAAIVAAACLIAWRN